MTITKKITKFQVSWIAENEQYRQNHGIASTDWTHCATGCGATLREAFEDALNDLCEQDIDLGAYHIIHDADGTNRMLSIEQKMIADLTSQVKEPEMLDWDIARAECSEQGSHSKVCPQCEGIGLEDESIPSSDGDDCPTCHGEHEVEDTDPDCAVCAGEWHYYVSIDVKVVRHRLPPEGQPLKGLQGSSGVTRKKAIQIAKSTPKPSIQVMRMTSGYARININAMSLPLKRRSPKAIIYERPSRRSGASRLRELETALRKANIEFVKDYEGGDVVLLHWGADRSKALHCTGRQTGDSR